MMYFLCVICSDLRTVDLPPTLILAWSTSFFFEDIQREGFFHCLSLGSEGKTSSSDSSNWKFLSMTSSWWMKMSLRSEIFSFRRRLLLFLRTWVHLQWFQAGGWWVLRQTWPERWVLPASKQDSCGLLLLFHFGSQFSIRAGLLLYLFFLLLFLAPWGHLRPIWALSQRLFYGDTVASSNVPPLEALPPSNSIYSLQQIFITWLFLFSCSVVSLEHPEKTHVNI